MSKKPGAPAIKTELLGGTALPPAAGDYVTVEEIAEGIGMSKRTVRRSLKRLVARGLLELTPDPEQPAGYLIRVPGLRGEEG